MQRPYEDDALWRETYRMSEVNRLQNQQHDPSESLDEERLFALCLEAIDRRWAKQNPRTAERMKSLFQMRFIEEKSQEECGVVLNVTRERVHQMGAQLLTTIRDYLRRLGVKP